MKRTNLCSTHKINSLTLESQKGISPYNVNAFSRRKVMRRKKIINYEMFLDLHQVLKAKITRNVKTDSTNNPESDFGN